MTVRELKRELKKCAPDAEVRGYGKCEYCKNVVAEDVCEIRERTNCGSGERYVFIIGSMYKYWESLG